MMRRALELATHGHESDPNPRVGCVVTDASGEPVGSGWHVGAGAPHAERVALAEAGSRARGGTVYVTLEPCRHTGRTGPCVEALQQAGIRRVVHAQTDPNAVAAGGADALRALGVAVTGGVLAAEAERLNLTWSHLMHTGRPWVTWKLASTLDGRSAAVDGTSQWITGKAARADVHEQRARCGAIVVGTGTVVRDDPQLTARRPDGTLYDRQPLRVVMGSRTIPVVARVLDATAPTLHLGTHDPHLVVSELAERGIHHIWLEGGPVVAAAFLRAGLVDEVIAYVAPVLLGSGRPVVGALGIGTIGDALRLGATDIRQFGDDVRITAAVSQEAMAAAARGRAG